MTDRTQANSATHTPTPWEYRQWEHDDWGWIRGPKDMAENGETVGPLVALARCGHETYDARDAHRRNGTDPYEANARFIVEACNSYASLKARIAELESNEKAYEEIIGKKTYREVADLIGELESELASERRK